MKTKDDINKIHRIQAPLVPFGPFMAGYRAAERQHRLDRNEGIALICLGAATGTAIGLIVALIIAIFG